MGKVDETSPVSHCAKSSAVQKWLYSYEIPDTTCVLSKTLKKVFVMTTPGKAKFFQKLKGSKSSAIPIEVLTSDKDLQQAYATLIKLLKSMSAGSGIVNLGTFKSEIPKQAGNYAKGWYSALKNEGSIVQHEMADVFSELFSQKSDSEIQLIRTAANIASNLLNKRLRKDVELAIEEDKEITHGSLSRAVKRTVENIENEEGFPQLEDANGLSLSFDPIIQSGGAYNLQDFLIGSDESKLHYGTITTQIGISYHHYHATIGRTYMVNVTTQEEKNYDLLTKIRMAALHALKPNQSCSSVYQACIEKINKLSEMNTDISSNLTRYFLPDVGYGIGIETEERYLELNATNATLIQAGMVFVVRVAFQDIPENDPSSAQDRQKKKYSMILADTVVVERNKLKIVTRSETTPEEVIYSLGSSSDEEEDLSAMVDETKILEHRTRQVKPTQLGEDKRKQAQEAIFEKKQRELQGNKKVQHSSKSSSKEYTIDMSLADGKTVSYKSVDYLPKQKLHSNRIIVDEKKESVLLPIGGTHVPFHVSTIKSVSKSDEADAVFLRIIFKSQVTSFGKTYEPAHRFLNSHSFLREVSFRSKQGDNLNYVTGKIKDVIKKVRHRERDLIQRASLIKQEPLKLIKNAHVPRLREVMIRPAPKGKKTTGLLEGHKNGVRFTSRGGKIDIIYSNIRYCFFQAAKNDRIVLIHFHLKHGIMIGKKKHKDIQFYTEVMEEYDQLVGRFRKIQSDHESMAEQVRQERLKRKLNIEFNNFAKKIESLSGLEFDTPYRDLEFPGTPHKANVNLCPTVNCLVNLSEYPFFVLSLDDVELAVFERIRFSLKNFDLTFILKDYTKPSILIGAIPVKSLDLIKDWFNQVEIKYYESSINLKWDKILATVSEDPEWDPWSEDGWKAIFDDDAESETDEELQDRYSPPSEDGYESEEYGDKGPIESESDELEPVEEPEAPSWDEMARQAELEEFKKRKRETEGESFGRKRRKH